MSTNHNEPPRSSEIDTRTFPAEDAYPNPDGPPAWRRSPDDSVGWREICESYHVDPDAHEEVTSS
ncbi:MAG: hypothetical protein ABEJ05_04605 [Haloglomus sp.]